MKIIRASEISTYRFCKRAWWYQLQGYSSDNKIELAEGNEVHYQHGQVVAASIRLRILAFVSLVLTILTAAIWLIGRLY